MRRLAALSLVVTVLLGAAGCAAESVPLVSTPRPSSSTGVQTPEPTPAAVFVPESRFSFDCEGLAPPVQEASTDPLPLVATIPRANDTSTWMPGPAQYVFERLGDLTCTYGDATETTRPYARLILVADGSAPHDDVVGSGWATSECRVDAGEMPRCWSVGLSNGVYIEFFATGPGVTEERYTAAADAIDSQIAQHPPRAAPRPGPDVIPLSDACEGLLPVAAIEAQFGLPIDVSHPEGGWSIEAYLLQNELDAFPCHFAEHGADPWTARSFGSLSWLPAGRWAFEKVANGTELPLGAGGEDRAILACDTPDVMCAVDVSVGGHWVRYRLDPAEVPIDRRNEVATTLATTIVETVRGRQATP